MSHIAFVFPGQGSQKIGMLSELAQDHALIKQTFDEASDVLDYNMWELIQLGEQEQINLTERTQPILLASSVAIWRLWNEHNGTQPSQMAGHSLGEWSALVCSGVVDSSEA